MISMLFKFWMALFSPQQTQQTAVNIPDFTEGISDVLDVSAPSD